MSDEVAVPFLLFVTTSVCERQLNCFFVIIYDHLKHLLYMSCNVNQTSACITLASGLKRSLFSCYDCALVVLYREY
jgi:hypothetical protein